MRAVNLLPEGERPAPPAQPVKGSSYVVLGVLGALVIATATYVMTTNQISSRTGDIAQARADIEAANARAGALGPFQQFAQIKQTRLASVQQLAQQRFDWERLMRELALVLPDGAFVSQVTASAAGSEEDAAAGAPVPADPAAAAAVGSPSATLAGCATSQREVAVVLVRLRQLHRAADVALADSTRTDESGGGGTAASGAAAGAGGCGPGNYGFNATVTFEPEPAEIADAPADTPTRLGGGS